MKKKHLIDERVPKTLRRLTSHSGKTKNWNFYQMDLENSCILKYKTHTTRHDTVVVVLNDESDRTFSPFDISPLHS